MSKQKTIKAVAKRFKITKTGKVMKKKAGQGHFNAREPGKVTRAKRRPTQMGKSLTKNIKRFMPHS
ncbi:50S ribosomal protein L35 [Candidatus Kuenenbacteria bacterium]|nr:50S ribosomal protein L35 [Candidatus Kuenenbacteria bacterium]